MDVSVEVPKNPQLSVIVATKWRNVFSNSWSFYRLGIIYKKLSKKIWKTKSALCISEIFDDLQPRGDPTPFTYRTKLVQSLFFFVEIQSCASYRMNEWNQAHGLYDCQIGLSINSFKVISMRGGLILSGHVGQQMRGYCYLSFLKKMLLYVIKPKFMHWV